LNRHILSIVLRIMKTSHDPVLETEHANGRSSSGRFALGLMV
jgi:hypothetical protein